MNRDIRIARSERIPLRFTGWVLSWVLMCTLTGCAVGRAVVQDTIRDTGGIDIVHYGLDVKIDPDRKRVSGEVIWTVRRVEDPTRLVVELDAPLEIFAMEIARSESSVREVEWQPVRYTDGEDSGQYRVDLPSSIGLDELFLLRVQYGGDPRVAETPPWDGGFVWSESPDGTPWIGVTAQMSGASVWWPSRNLPSDRPDSVSLKWTVPDDLIVASNGLECGVTEVEPGWRQWCWEVRHPISPYQVSLNAGPFQQTESRFTGRDGVEVPLQIWTLPESEDRAAWLMDELHRQLDFFDRWLGPYPFPDEKLGVVQTPYLGMEHQTILAYGSTFSYDGLFRARLGFDDLLHHELAHEWFGNMVVNRDWSHFWMHEGFATYMQALFAGELSGRTGYMRMLRRIRPLIRSRVPLVPDGPASTDEMAEEGRSADVYYKGAWILHTLREWIGPNRFDPLLKSFLWEGPGSGDRGDPPSRVVDSEMWIEWLEENLDEPVRPVLELYLYQARLPYLEMEVYEEGVVLYWSDPEMVPVPLVLDAGGGRDVVTLPEEGFRLEGVRPEELTLDPDHSILMGEPVWGEGRTR